MSLFTPIKVGNFELKHKVVMAPLTRMRAPGHVPGKYNAEYYAQRAASPGTLIITEATFISKAAAGHPDAPGIWSSEQVESWRNIFEGIHKNNSFVFVQLWALGLRATPTGVDSDIRVVSASDGEVEGRRVHGLTKAEIKEYVQAYARAAKNAIDAGADGVEIHSANGYLPDQFLHSQSNRRTDEYGGSIENRARFVLEVVDAISKEIGSERLGIRFSPWGEEAGMNPKITGSSPVPQFSYIVSELQAQADAGKPLAYIHVVEPRIVSGWVESDKYKSAKCDLNGFIRNVWDGPIIRAGAMLDHYEEVVEKDDNTLAAFGRWFIANPDLPSRLEKKLPLTKYDRPTFYAPGPNGYIDYPFYNEPALKETRL